MFKKIESTDCLHWGKERDENNHIHNIPKEVWRKQHQKACELVCLNTLILAIMEARDTKLTIKVPDYHTQIKLYFNYWLPRPLFREIVNSRYLKNLLFLPIQTCRLNSNLNSVEKWLSKCFNPTDSLPLCTHLSGTLWQLPVTLATPVATHNVP